MHKEFFEFCSLLSSEKSFTPNLTSALIAKTAVKALSPNSRVLDIGSGNGSISFFIEKSFDPPPSVVGVEAHHPALTEARRNAERLRSNVIFRDSTRLNSELRKAPNLIINDVSGISSEVSRYTDWFDNATKTQDVDGIEQCYTVFRSIAEHHPSLSGCVVIFPSISLSNTERLISLLENDWVLECVESLDWPSPVSLTTPHAIKALNELMQRGVINFKVKFGLTIFNTSIWKATHRHSR
jgi:hypothetical protein